MATLARVQSKTRAAFDLIGRNNVTLPGAGGTDREPLAITIVAVGAERGELACGVRVIRIRVHLADLVHRDDQAL